MLEEIKNARQKVSAEVDIHIADNHTHTHVWTSVQDPYSTCTSFQTSHQSLCAQAKTLQYRPGNRCYSADES